MQRIADRKIHNLENQSLVVSFYNQSMAIGHHRAYWHLAIGKWAMRRRHSRIIRLMCEGVTRHNSVSPSISARILLIKLSAYFPRCRSCWFQTNSRCFVHTCLLARVQRGPTSFSVLDICSVAQRSVTSIKKNKIPGKRSSAHVKSSRIHVFGRYNYSFTIATSLLDCRGAVTLIIITDHFSLCASVSVCPSITFERNDL